MWGLFNWRSYQDSTTDKTKRKVTKIRRNKKKKERNTITCKRFNKLNLLGKNIDKRDKEFYWDKLEKNRLKNSIRIMFQNIQQLPIKRNQGKSKSLFSYIKKMKIKIMMMSEIGLNWSVIDKRDKLKEGYYSKSVYSIVVLFHR